MPAAPLFLFRRWPSVVLATALLPLTLSCKKDNPDPVEPNKVTLEFQHNAPGDSLPLQLGTQYLTATGQTYQLDLLAYYVSNIKLVRTDGSTWVEPRSYHLMRLNSATDHNPVVALASVPAGTYTAVEFSIGLDSVTNHHGDQTGALSPNEGMYWPWSGYKFWVMEGGFWPIGGNPENILYHIGSDPQFRTVRLTFPSAATVTSTIAPKAHMFVDVNGFFTGINLADSNQRNSMMTTDSTLTSRLADNLTTMFRVESVHNE